MIYEVRTYTLRPGTTAEFEERYEKRLPSRVKHSKLGGFWHTEFGPLNQVVHVYPYDDLQHRTRVRSAMANDRERNAMPGGGEFIVAQEAEIVIPAPFMRELGSRNYGTGNVYEMRTYTYAPGDIPKVLDAWGKAIEAREKFSPLAACWTSELGGLNKFTHIWVYKDLNERARVREESRRPGGRGRHRPVSARSARKTNCWYRRPSRRSGSQNRLRTSHRRHSRASGNPGFQSLVLGPRFRGGDDPVRRRDFFTHSGLPTYFCRAKSRSPNRIATIPDRNKVTEGEVPMIIRVLITAIALLLAGYAFWDGALSGGHVLQSIRNFVFIFVWRCLARMETTR